MAQLEQQRTTEAPKGWSMKPIPIFVIAAIIAVSVERCNDILSRRRR